MKGVRRKAPMSENGPGKERTHPEPDDPHPRVGGTASGRSPRPPQRGPVERSERVGEADRGEEGKGRWEGKGRKCVADNPESGAAGPSAERSEVLLSGGRTVAPVTERGRAKPAGSAPTPSASMCKRDDRVGRERGGPSSGAPRQGRRATVTGASGRGGVRSSPGGTYHNDREAARLVEQLDIRPPQSK